MPHPAPPRSDRLPEKWFRRGLWLLSAAFAACLMGLGGQIISDLPQTEPEKPLSHYLPAAEYTALKQKKQQLEQQQAQLDRQSEQAELRLTEQQSLIQTEQKNLNNRLAARAVTRQPEQDAEVLARTRALDTLREQEKTLQQHSDRLRQQQLDNAHARAANAEAIEQLERHAHPRKQADDQRIELTVFLYRLALTLPLLLAAGWLFTKQRQSRWWPFVWGFIWFALFTFFVELVPYLPSYGGYVRYAVGLILTVLAGRYALNALQHYLERKRAEENLPQSERQRHLHYDQALAAIGKNICPSCERSLDFSHPQLDFCPHCSIRLFRHCTHCQTRYSAFYRYCLHCGKEDENRVEN